MSRQHRGPLDIRAQSENYVAVRWNTMGLKDPRDVLEVMEEIRAEGYRPLHYVTGNGFGVYVCEKIKRDGERTKAA